MGLIVLKVLTPVVGLLYRMLTCDVQGQYDEQDVEHSYTQQFVPVLRSCNFNIILSKKHSMFTVWPLNPHWAYQLISLSHWKHSSALFPAVLQNSVLSVLRSSIL